MPEPRKDNDIEKKDQEKSSVEKSNPSPKKNLPNDNKSTSIPSEKVNKQKRKAHKETHTEKKEKKNRSPLPENTKLSDKKEEARTNSKRRAEMIARKQHENNATSGNENTKNDSIKQEKSEKQKNISKSSNSEVVLQSSKSSADKSNKKMEEETLDDDETYPYYQKHPVLYGVFIPDNSACDLIYINKKSFTIARRRNADYVMPDRRISSDGIRIQVSISYDQAEFTACRNSASIVLLNDTIHLEYNPVNLVNGDTLTFADGSRFTFYNLYNHRDLDEITVDENSLIRFVRKNTLDESEKIYGSVSYLEKDTNFDKIDHTPVVPVEEEIGDYMDEEDYLPYSPELSENNDSPFNIKGSLPSSIIPEPIITMNPVVPENEKDVKKSISDLRKELFHSVSDLNRIVNNAEKGNEEEEMSHHVKSSEDGNIFEDGDGTVAKTVKRDKKALILQSVLDDRSLPAPISYHISPAIVLPSHRPVSSPPMDNKRSRSLYISDVSALAHPPKRNDNYDERTFILYRSKHKMLIATKDVYDIVIDTYFKQMMEGIDMEDIRLTLSQSNSSQYTNFKSLFKKTLLDDIVTPEKNTITFENCGYHITESFQRYCCLLFQSYIQNENYHEKKDGVDSYNYIPQFVRMPCENGKKYMNNIIYSIANVHKADVMLFNFEKNLLIEGTPLCYRKYLFGLFPSTVHIKPAVHSIPKKESSNDRRNDRRNDMLMDDGYFSLLDDMNGYDDDMDVSEAGDLDELLGDDFLHGDGDDENVEPMSEGEKNDVKEDDDINEGDIVVVSPLEKDKSSSSIKKPIVFHYPHSISIPAISETSKYKEKERRAVVVKTIGANRLIVRYLDKEESEDRPVSLRSRYSVDLSDSLMNSTNERDIKKRYKSQLLARSLHACRRSQVRKWVDEDDQKFLLMKCVNEILNERNEVAKQTKERKPLFIVFEDAPLLIRRRNANILSLLNIQDKSFSYPIFIILTEKIRYHTPQPQNDMMMIGGLSMNVIMSGSLRPKSENRSHIEQYFDSVMEKSFTLPYPGCDITTQTDIMILEVPTPQDTKYKYSFDRKVEEDDKAALRIKHLKELSFFLRSHHLYCLDLKHVRYLDMKRIKFWIPIIRMAYSLQCSQGMKYMKESELFDVYSKAHDSITLTGKPIYVSENSPETLYGIIERKNLEYAIKVGYNTDKESHPDPAQEIRCKNESEKRLIQNGSFISPNNINVGFDDVGSLENVKAKLKETIILPLRRPEIFAQSSLLKSCKGLLLFGPPGTGKTMLAKALARESGANFLSIATSTIFNKYVGDSEQNTRAIFTLAARLSPCVIFIDEIDSLLSSRDQNSSGQEYSRKVKNEFMSSWDGLMTDENLRVVVIGCTNRPFDLDDAVLRRFSRKLLVDLPDAEQREKILKVILRKEKLADDVDLKAIASDTMTKGFSGSDLYNLCQTAAYMPIREIVAKEEKNPSAGSQPKMDSMGLLSLEEDDDKMDVEEEETITVRPLTMKDFEAASKEITFSFEESNSAIRAIREWNEKYGDNGSRKTDDLSYYI